MTAQYTPLSDMAATWANAPSTEHDVGRQGAQRLMGDMLERDIPLNGDTVRALWLGAQSQQLAMGHRAVSWVIVMVVGALAAEVETPGCVLTPPTD